VKFKRQKCLKAETKATAIEQVAGATASIVNM